MSSATQAYWQTQQLIYTQEQAQGKDNLMMHLYLAQCLLVPREKKCVSKEMLPLPDKTKSLKVI